ncbi:MAG: sugar-binding transcriptional regulator, partial [Mesorhizobium sp.]
MAIRPAEQLIHKAAWLYYAHGLRQDEVASQLNISRASVAMYLRKARETGIVNISTSTQLFTDDVMARRLEDALKLDAVWIAPENAYLADPSTDIAVLAASVFLELVRKGDRIGVAWGRTVYTIADIMSYADLQDVTVVQLCGNLGAPYSYRPDQCTMEIARRLNAKGLNFYAPLVLSTEALAQG